MPKTFNFLIITFLYLFSLCNNFDSKILENYDTNNSKNTKEVNFNGRWSYEFNSNENELLNRTFELSLIQNKDIIKGQYCAVARGGNRIDCSDEEINNISGIIKGNVAFINFTGFYDAKSKGKAKLYFDSEENLVWEILEVKGEIYAPNKAVLKGDKDNNDIAGLYSLNSCENSRFKIKIEQNNSDYPYSILDKNKIILKGKALINKTQIKLGKIEGVISDNRIVIQNYGDSKNEYFHFTQCDEKYLTFEK